MPKKPEGWKNDPARHGLAAKGITTRVRKLKYPVVVPYRFTTRARRAYNSVKDHNLTMEEWVDLRDLINVIDVVDCFGVSDCARREQLEHKATEDELRAAWVDAGMPAEQFDDAYT